MASWQAKAGKKITQTIPWRAYFGSAFHFPQAPAFSLG
jgi:hypothetical protein